MKVFATAAIILLAGCGQKNSEDSLPQSNAPVEQSTAANKDPFLTWTLSSKKDELTDASKVIAMLGAKNGRGHTFIAVRCIDKNFDVLTSFNEYLGNDNRPVKFRMDQLEMQESSWMPTGDGTSLYANNESDFVRQILKSKKLIMEASDFRGVSHRTVYEWTAGEDAITAAMDNCNILKIGLDEKIPGIRKDVAQELERWGPKKISANKQGLAELAGYKGPINAELDDEFVQSAQTYLDSYIDGCRQGKIKGGNCTSLKFFWKEKMKPLYPSVSSVIYEQAPKSLKEQLGSIKAYE